MEYTYKVRGKVRTVNELENVAAIKPTDSSPKSQSTMDVFGARTNLKLSDFNREELTKFESAGWIFVTPGEQVKAAQSRGQPLPDTEPVSRVFIDKSGHLLLSQQKLVLRLQDDLTEAAANAFLTTHHLQRLHKIAFAPRLYEVRVDGEELFAMAETLSALPEVIYAEPSFIEALGSRLTPTDPDYDEQWHLNNSGQDGGTVGADIGAEGAWDMTRGAGIRVAQIDNGIDVSHPDLAAAVNGTSGYFISDGAGGANFVQGITGFPSANHGTFCAGLLAARSDNGNGGTGVANQADLTAIACMTDQVGTQTTLARAVAYAADPSTEVAGADPANGADVISCSLGPNGADWAMTSVMQDAIDFAVTNGRGGLGSPIFWAVTNGNFEIQFDEVCAYANTIAVGRSTRDDLEDNCGHGPELDFLATGVDVYSCTLGGGYGVDSGTSYAAPVAAGVGALVLAVNADLTWQEVRQIIRDTCDKIGGSVYGADNHNDDYGYGRVNAAMAVCTAGRVVELQTDPVVFNDVPEDEQVARAIVFNVTSCLPATFQILSGPAVTSGPGSFTSLPSPNAALPATSSLGMRQARLWIAYTGQDDGDITSGEVTVRLVETGEEWVIDLSANTIARPTVAVALALDKSGSMQQPSGLAGFATRNDVLKFAAPVFINLIQEDNAIGIVSFDHDAYQEMAAQTVGPVGPFDAVRAAALGVIGAHSPNPGGNTAIGDAVEAAQANVGATSGFDETALVVFTDGHETASKYLSEVAPLINDRVFAIGLGTADQIQPSALTTLTNGTGGYLLLTGHLGPDDQFLLSKYYLQILAGVTNHDIVLDPEGSLKPGQKKKIPFHLNEADVSVDAILFGEANIPLFRWSLETPNGDIITPSVASTMAGSTYVTAQGVSFYRMTLPVPMGIGARAGKWHALLEVDPKYYQRYLSQLDNYPEQVQQVLAHGVRYSLNVQSYTGLRLQAFALQDSHEPGAKITLRGVLTEYGIPIGGNRAGVKVQLDRPDGTQTTLTLQEVEADSGIYEATLTAAQAGVYRCRYLANGTTLRGRLFSREALRSAAVWKGGDLPPPHSGDGNNGGGDNGGGNPSDGSGNPDVCRIIQCLLHDKVLTPKLQKNLQALGLDVEALRKCLSVVCRKTQRPPLTHVPSVAAPSPLNAVAYTKPLAQTPATMADIANLTRQVELMLASQKDDGGTCC